MIKKILKLIKGIPGQVKGKPEHCEGGRQRTRVEKGVKNLIQKRKAKKLHKAIMNGTAPRGRTI